MNIIDITFSSSSSMLFSGRELGFWSNGASMSKFNGLRSIENPPFGAKPSGFVSISGSKCRSIKAMAPPTVSAPKRETDPKKRVVITGMGLVSVFGNDVDVFYDKLLAGESGISVIDTFDVSNFSVRIAGQIRGFSTKGYIDSKNDRRLDDCWRYCLVAGKKALENANLGPEVLKLMDREKVGVIIGTVLGGGKSVSNAIETFNMKGGYKRVTPFTSPYSVPAMGSALLAIESDLRGPNYSVSASCATSNSCFYEAASLIRSGEAEIMVVGGTDSPILPTSFIGIISTGGMSKRNGEPESASRPWSKSRDGYVLGEGSGILIMESLESAMRRGVNIVGEYLGGAVTCDAHHYAYPRPDGLQASTCIAKSLKNAGVSPEEVNYVNCHATSTCVGDLPEVKAIKRVFKNTSEMKINATKSMIGHSLGASGVLEAIATIKAINTGWLHPTINQHDLDPYVTIDTVPEVKKQHEVNVAISNSFGFGGHNAVAVFAPFKP